MERKGAGTIHIGTEKQKQKLPVQVHTSLYTNEYLPSSSFIMKKKIFETTSSLFFSAFKKERAFFASTNYQNSHRNIISGHYIFVGHQVMKKKNDFSGQAVTSVHNSCGVVEERTTWVQVYLKVRKPFSTLVGRQCWLSAS